MFVSVIIPCRNEEKYIAQCIDSILESDYAQEKIEIIVVDGLSDDRTLEIINTYTNTYSNIILVENAKKTTQWALNMGIHKSKGNCIIILGAHAALDKKYISACVEFLGNNTDVACVGGVIQNVYEDNTSKIIAYAMSSNFGVGNAHFRTGSRSGYVDTVAFGAYRREVFDNIGFFDEELVRNQDDEYNFRLIKNGFKIFLDTNLKLRYYARASFKKLFMQYFQYGYWKVFVNKKHKTITTIRQTIPALFVLFLASGLVMPIFNIYIRFFYKLIILIYLLIAIKSGLDKTQTFKELLMFIYACIILHVSYGSGYVWGIISFIILGKKPSNFSKNITR